MAVDAHHPGNVGRNLRLELAQCRGKLVELGRGLKLHLGGAGIEQHVGRKYEPIADDLEIRPAAKRLLQFAEKV